MGRIKRLQRKRGLKKSEAGLGGPRSSNKMPADNADGALAQRRNNENEGETHARNVRNVTESLRPSGERDEAHAYIGNNNMMMTSTLPAEVVHLNTMPAVEVQNRRAVEDFPARERGVLRGEDYSSARDIETMGNLYAHEWNERARGQPLYELPVCVPHIQVVQPRFPTHGAGTPIVAGSFDRGVAEYHHNYHHRPRQHDGQRIVNIQRQQMLIQQKEQELELLKRQRLQQDASMVNASTALATSTHETPGNASGRDRFVRNVHSGARRAVHTNPQATSAPIFHSLHDTGVHQAVQPSFLNTGTHDTHVNVSKHKM